MCRNLIIRTLSLFALATSPITGAVIQVPADQPTIQAGINAALAGDEVVVAPGTYHERINFNGKAITLRSSDGPQTTIIDASFGGRVVTCQTSEGPDTVLEGFTIMRGRVSGYASGAGMLIVRASPTVANCVFRKNHATVNRGLGRGGAMFIFHGSPLITNCVFMGNLAHYGAGIYNYSALNEADSRPTITNCVFSGNATTYNGAGIYNWGGAATITNCSFSANTAGGVGGAVFHDDSNAKLFNCVLWGDIPDELVNDGIRSPVVSHSVIQGGLPPGTTDGGNNGNSDPLFVDADGPDNIPGTFDDNLRLASTSLCGDAGDNSAIPAGASTDLDGNPHIVNHHVDMGAYEHYALSDCVSASSCPEADIDCNDVVDGLDIAVITSSANWSWPTDAALDRLADTNLDGMVNGLDVALATSSRCFGR